MDDIDEKIKGRIKKLLSLAASSNEHEASTAMRQAMKLMAKHSISESQLAKEKIETKKFYPEYKRLPQWVAVLYLGICKALGCYAVYQHGRHGRLAVVTLCGKKSDIEKALYILIVSKNLIYRQSKNFHSDNPWVDRGQLDDYRKGLSYGFTDRLKKEYATVEAVESSGTGLVPVDSRVDEAKGFYLADNKVKGVTIKTGLYGEQGRSDSNLIDVKEPIRDSSVKGRLTG